jgi:transposase
VVEQPKPDPVRKPRKPRGVGGGGEARGIIEPKFGGVPVRVGRGAEARTITAVIQALKATP